MKIVCMSSSLCLGGAERQIIGLASTLRDLGHDVEILTYHDREFYQDAVASLHIRHHLIKKRFSTFALIKRIADHLRETSCDVLISFRAGTSVKACLAHKLYPGFRLYVSERNFNTSFHLHDRLRFFAFREADRIICNNYSQRDFIESHYPDFSSKLVAINNFVDLDFFSPGPSRPCGHPRRIIVVARVTARKNLHGLIKAAALLRDRGLEFKIDWYGLAHNNGYCRRCRRMVARLGLEDVIEIHPAVHDVRAEYRTAELLCLPSFYEGTSNSIAEALACGLPVACSRIGDNVLYVKENENGFLFNPADSEDIAAALERALTVGDTVLYEYGLESRRIAERCLDRKDFAAKYAQII